MIKKTLSSQGMRCGIGVTTGEGYCGSVGNEVRCEYAIVGDCVNLSARLMANAHNDILCDQETEHLVTSHHESSHGIRFEAKGKIKVKGKAHEIVIFRPLYEEHADSLGQPETIMLGYRASSCAFATVLVLTTTL